MMPGSFVIHPLFPKWGKGEITAIFKDTQTGKSIAKIMWNSSIANHASLHTLEHLLPYGD